MLTAFLARLFLLFLSSKLPCRKHPLLNQVKGGMESCSLEHIAVAEVYDEPRLATLCGGQQLLIAYVHWNPKKHGLVSSVKD